MSLHMSCSLNSLKGGYIGDYIGDYSRVIKEDSRSLDYSSYMKAAQATSMQDSSSASLQGAHRRARTCCRLQLGCN